MLPAGHRLRASADFSAALRGSERAPAVRSGSRLIVIHATMTDARAGLPPRVGFVVSKAVGGAVVRNRTKRRLRALTAARLSRLPIGSDVVIRANPLAGQADSAQLAVELNRQLDRVCARLEGRRS